MHIINITVRNKVAVNPAQDRYVCGNSDYIVRFDFDAEWEAFETKTARFVKEDGSYVDQIFSGNDCPVPVISDTYKLQVGVYAGNLSTTTAAYVPCKKSILCGGGVPAAPAPDVYAQIMAKLNNLSAAQANWAQNNVAAADYVHNRTHYYVSSFNIPEGTEIPEDAVSAQVMQQTDAGEVETGSRLCKMADITPASADLLNSPACYVGINAGSLFTADHIVNETAEGYVISQTIKTANGKIIYAMRGVVCFKAGYRAECDLSGSTKGTFAVIPEPGLYLLSKGDEAVTLAQLRWAGYTRTIDDRYIPDSIARKDDLHEPVTDEHINRLIDKKLSGFGNAYILPETALVMGEDRLYIHGAWASAPVVGNVYTVVYNGVKYECEAVAMPDNPDTPPGAFLMGNIAPMGFEGLVGNPDAPFAMLAMPEPMDGVLGFVAPREVAETYTLAIMGNASGYYFFDGSTARLVTIEQLKADLGLA